MQLQTAGLKPTTVPLRTDIALARSWADLELLCERIDSAYCRGDLDLANAEELSALAAITAAGVPEGLSIPAEALVDREACSRCGATDRRSSGAIICHPAPAIRLDNRQAA